MTQVKFNNHPYKSLSNLVNGFFNEIPSGLGQEFSFGFPPVNIHETSDAYHLEVSAPGRSKEDIKLNVDNGLLTISYEKKDEATAEDYKTVRKEFSFKNFKRSFTLDERIDANGVQAKYENGVLKVLLPKKEQAKAETKQITIA
ncbi:MAG TPA: Hsp20/alpha crystallin family protein [Puia sp.]|nr:Hsp20/alpha crystallin family protein [Puia sp.]